MKSHTSKLIQGLVLSLCGITAAQGATYTEVGDAGDLLSTAQVSTGTGSLTHIYGYLGENGGQGDVDLYRIVITDPTAFSVSVTASLSADNDAVLYLFDESGHYALMDDDAGVGYLPGMVQGSFATGTPGDYYLAFFLFATDPIYTGSALSGWNHMPAPLQSGNYSLALTGATFASAPSAVPVPAAAWLFGSGMVGLIGVARRKQAA